MYFRTARPAGAAWNVTKTLAYVVFLWFLFLLVIPIAVSIVEVELGIQRFPPQATAALTLLIIFSALGLWAALTLALAGGGTPMPYDTARDLVVSGPYAYLRHPFVAAIIKSRSLRGRDRIGAVLGSTRDRRTRDAVDFALPCSPRTTRIG